MTTPIKITGTVDAWLTNSSDSISEILGQDGTGDVISRLGFSAYDMSTGSYPWTRVGTAEVTVTLLPVSEVVAAQVQTLNKELQKERAESVQRQNAILDRISKLQALTNEVPA